MSDPFATPRCYVASAVRSHGWTEKSIKKDLGTQSAVGDKELDEDVDVHQLGDTTMLRGRSDGGSDVVGHWRRQASVTVLAKLLYDIGKEYTAQALLYWWLHAKKIVKKREHPTVPDRKAAGQLKKHMFGYYGFPTYEQ